MPPAALGVDTMLLMMDCIEDDEILQTLVILVIIACLSVRKRKRDHNPESYSMIARMPHQIRHLNRLIGVTNADCIANLRMNRNTFGRLVSLLRELGGLVDEKYVTVEEQVATFLGILAHHKKNRVVGFDYLRSGQTISKYVHAVLKSVLMLHGVLLVKPEPIPNDCNDPRWRWFKV